MNLVQFKTNIHEFERCERDVILFILAYLTEKYIHRGGGGGGEGGGDFSISIRSRFKKAKLRGFKSQDFQGSGQVCFAKLYSSKVCMSCAKRTGYC